MDFRQSPLASSFSSAFSHQILKVTDSFVKNRVSNRTWTRTVNPNEPFHFGEPEPNLNQQNFTSVNLNQTWTLKIVLK